jgi:hypothetical protein
MKHVNNKLGFYKYILPRLIQELELPEYSPSGDDYDVLKWKDVGDKATIFDCRSLPAAFVEHTGEAALEELFALKRPIKLPYENCYFEFNNQLGILACEVDKAVHFRLFPLVWGDGWYPEKEFGLGINDKGDVIYGEFENENYDDVELPWGITSWNTEQPADNNNITTAANFLGGVLTLLDTHLVATEIKPDPAPALTKARAKKGLPPASSETRVLTINTAAVRRTVTATKLHTHESPRLHWRRGHWRVIHRFSEFEGRTWIRRCLVGNPDRGFVDKDYRVIWNVPMVH